MEPQHSKKRKFKETNGASKKDDNATTQEATERSKKRKESKLAADPVVDGPVDDAQQTTSEAEDEEPNWEDEGNEDVGEDKPADDIADDKNLSLPPAAGSTSDRFADLKLCEKSMKSIEKMGFETMTEIQRRAIPPLLAGKVSCL